MKPTRRDVECRREVAGDSRVAREPPPADKNMPRVITLAFSFFVLIATDRDRWERRGAKCEKIHPLLLCDLSRKLAQITKGVRNHEAQNQGLNSADLIDFDPPMAYNAAEVSCNAGLCFNGAAPTTQPRGNKLIREFSTDDVEGVLLILCVKGSRLCRMGLFKVRNRYIQNIR